MPDPNDYDDEEDWMAACVPVVMDENGGNRDQAVAQCLNMWRDKSVDEPIVEIKDEPNPDVIILDEVLDLGEDLDDGRSGRS